MFLGLLPEPCRVSYLPVLHDILHSTNPFNWRLRRALAIQLPALIDLPPKSEVYSMLFPLVMTLLQDPVADVRKDSFKGVARLVTVLYEQSKAEIALEKEKPVIDEERDIKPVREALFDESDGNINDHSSKGKQATHDLETVIRGLNMLIRGETYQIRQLWLELCRQLLIDLPRELFEKSFIDGILKLTCDHVSNVRVAVAIFLTGWEPDFSLPWDETKTLNNHSELNGNISEESNELSLDSISLNAKASEEDIESSNDPKSSDVDGKVSNPWKWLLQRTDIQECVKRLSKDDYDVFYNMVKLQALFPEIVFEKMSCRGLKLPPGGNEPIPFGGLSTNLMIPLELNDGDEGVSLLSPGHGGLDLSDSTAAHINYAAASPRTSQATRVYPSLPPSEIDAMSPGTMESLEGFEEFMNTMDMGPMHP